MLRKDLITQLTDDSLGLPLYAMKKAYVKPTTNVAQILQQHMICSSNVNTLSGGTFYDTPLPGNDTGGSIPRSRGFDDLWDEEVF